MDMTQSQGVSQ